MNRSNARVRWPGARGTMGEEADIENENRLYAGKKRSRLGKFRACDFLRLHEKVAVFATGNVMMSCFNSTGRNDESTGVSSVSRLQRVDVFV